MLTLSIAASTAVAASTVAADHIAAAHIVHNLEADTAPAGIVVCYCDSTLHPHSAVRSIQDDFCQKGDIVSESLDSSLLHYVALRR